MGLLTGKWKKVLSQPHRVARAKDEGRQEHG